MNKTPGRLLASLTAMLAVAGCASNPSHPIVIPDALGAVTPAVNNAAPSPLTAPAAAIPVSVDIPAIGVHATHLMPLGVNKDGSMQTPPVDAPMTLGWYTRGAHACTPGPDDVPFALAGHINGLVGNVHQPGVLVNLAQLKAGATVTIGLSDGKSCTYRINQLAQVSKVAFPTKTIWGKTKDAQIRIVSCGGEYVGAPLYYRDNLVGEGTLVS